MSTAPLPEGHDLQNTTATTAPTGRPGRSLDFRVHAGDVGRRLGVWQRPSPRDVEALLLEAAASRQVVISSARDAAQRLLSRMSTAHWWVEAPEAQVALGAGYVIKVVAAGWQSRVWLRPLPRPHVVRVSL